MRNEDEDEDEDEDEGGLRLLPQKCLQCHYAAPSPLGWVPVSEADLHIFHSAHNKNAKTTSLVVHTGHWTLQR